MNTKHTAGQWESVKTESISVPFIIKSGNKELANVCWGIRINTVETFEEVQANCQLIASAPTLLDELIKAKTALVNYISHEYKDEHCSWGYAIDHANRNPIIVSINEAIKAATE